MNPCLGHAPEGGVVVDDRRFAELLDNCGTVGEPVGGVDLSFAPVPFKHILAEQEPFAVAVVQGGFVGFTPVPGLFQRPDSTPRVAKVVDERFVALADEIAVMETVDRVDAAVPIFEIVGPVETVENPVI
jgi:hypothetical protein